VKVQLTFLFLLLAMSVVIGQNQSDWMLSIVYPEASLSSSFEPTHASFRNGTFTEFGASGEQSFSARLRNGQYEGRYKPFGSVEVELTGFHRLNEARTVFAIVEYHKISIGGSSSNNCFVDVVAFNSGANPTVMQQIEYGCDLSGSGSTVSATGTELTVRQGYKGDSRLAVVHFRWNQSRFDVVGHSTEPLAESR
jgi:hypothetical protein